MIFLLFLVSQLGYAHEGHHHGEHTQAAKIASAATEIKQAYSEIQIAYQKEISPIFEEKCAACHSKEITAPWYAKIPGVHSVIEKDRSEAKQHLEISQGFPFAGHGTPEEDLVSLKKTTSENEMPPSLYTWLHPSSKLTAEEKAKILSWIQESELKIAHLHSTEETP